MTYWWLVPLCLAWVYWLVVFLNSGREADLGSVPLTDERRALFIEAQTRER